MQSMGMRNLCLGRPRGVLSKTEALDRGKNNSVLRGFMGATVNGVTTTLGRGSSGLHGNPVGAALNTREIQIWTDVNGVKTADPSLVSSARTVSHLFMPKRRKLARLGGPACCIPK